MLTGVRLLEMCTFFLYIPFTVAFPASFPIVDPGIQFMSFCVHLPPIYRPYTVHILFFSKSRSPGSHLYPLLIHLLSLLDPFAVHFPYILFSPFILSFRSLFSHFSVPLIFLENIITYIPRPIGVPKRASTSIQLV